MGWYTRFSLGADLQGGWGLVPPYSWCINGNMGRVGEKKSWRNEKMERDEEKETNSSSILFCIRHWFSHIF